jgi:hypothetical protein
VLSEVKFLLLQHFRGKMFEVKKQRKKERKRKKIGRKKKNGE